MPLRRLILDALAPHRNAPAEDRHQLARETVANNVRVVRGLMPFLVVVHAANAIVLTRFTPSSPAHAAWLKWLVRLHTGLTVVAALLLIGALSKNARVRSWIGDAMTFIYLVAGGLLSANAQRTHAALNAFILCAFGAAIVLRPRPIVFGAGIVTAVAMVIAGALRFQESSVATANVFFAIALGFVASAIHFMTRAARIREWLARLELERANATLELRVDAKVRERSQDLSKALSKLTSIGKGSALVEGAVLDERFVIERALGFGGMGEVYRGLDKLTNAPVAIKVVQAQSARELDGLHRFLQESHAMASVRHPGIVRSLHVDISDEGRLFQVLELVEGQTLDERIKRDGPMKWQSAARMVAVLADALAAAHAAGIVHRDIKPANVMLTRSAPGLKLLDFGISKLRDANGDGRDDTGHRVLGTPEYMAPEQILAAGYVGGKADVYSIGLLSYECMTGKMPFPARSPMEWMEAHVQELPVDLGERGTGAPRELTVLVMSCLQKDPEARPTAAELAAAMAELADREKVPALDALEREHTPSLTPRARTIEEGPTLDAPDESLSERKS